jgi:GNAT superfamily N-acetyltransferase
MARIRPLASSDELDLIYVFKATAGNDLQKGGDAVLEIASYIWCRPYHLLAPGTSFVLDNGTGRVTGYILSVPDTTAFVTWYRSTYLPYCHAYGIDPPEMKDGKPPSWSEDLAGALRALVYSPEEMLHREYPHLLEQYPAHLHIDILPEYQRQGWGKKLMEELVSRLREQGVRGVHLVMAGDNVAAGRFYEAVGFETFDEVVDGGKSGDKGRDAGGGVWYVKKL